MSSPGAPSCPQKLPRQRNQPEVARIAAAHRRFPVGTEVRRRPVRRPPVTPTPIGPAYVLRVSSSPFTPAPHPFPAVDERLRPASHASLRACSAQGEANIALACLASMAIDMDPRVHRSVTVGHFYPSVKKSVQVILIPETFQNCCKSCKIHRILSVYQKIVYDPSKCSKK
jgi:hypothetical protein